MRYHGTNIAGLSVILPAAQLGKKGDQPRYASATPLYWLAEHYAHEAGLNSGEMYIYEVEPLGDELSDSMEDDAYLCAEGYRVKKCINISIDEDEF